MKIQISYTRDDSDWWVNWPVSWHHHYSYQACGLLQNRLILSNRISILFLYIQKEKMSLNALSILFLITDGNKNYNMTYELNKLLLLSRSNQVHYSKQHPEHSSPPPCILLYPLLIWKFLPTVDFQTCEESTEHCKKFFFCTKIHSDLYWFYSTYSASTTANRQQSYDDVAPAQSHHHVQSNTFFQQISVEKF